MFFNYYSKKRTNTRNHNLDYFYSRISINDGLIEKMESELLLHHDIKLFIIDTLQDAKGSGGSGNAYENDQQLLAPLQGFAMKNKVVVFCIHHLKWF